jgi:AcrR family transcriptional regulator
MSAAPSTPRRHYDGRRRRADARARQRRVVEAATRLFLDQGYGTASVTQIAAEADVSPQSVYATFGSKAGLLSRAVDVALVGDDEPVAMRDRPESQAVDAVPDPVERLRAAARQTRAVHERSAALLDLVERVSGADPAVAELAANRQAGAREDAERFVAGFPASERRSDRSVGELADVMTVLVSARNWMSLVVDKGWSPDRFEAWLADTYMHQILGVGSVHERLTHR